MSPRAACRLETLGFAQVFDYTAGKAEWLAYGFALVLSETQVLLGRLRKSSLEGTSTAIAGEVMESGPSTIRPTPTPWSLRLG